MTLVAFVFAGAAMVTSGNDFAIFQVSRVMQRLVLFCFWQQPAFAILNIKYIFSNQTQWKMLMENHTKILTSGQPRFHQ